MPNSAMIIARTRVVLANRSRQTGYTASERACDLAQSVSRKREVQSIANQRLQDFRRRKSTTGIRWAILGIRQARDRQRGGWLR